MGCLLPLKSFAFTLFQEDYSPAVKCLYRSKPYMLFTFLNKFSQSKIFVSKAGIAVKACPLYLFFTYS